MKVVILCGGLGTRIRDVADDIPKPMIPIGDYPILWHIMKRYASFGYTDFILCLGYKSESIKSFFLNQKSHSGDLTIDFKKSGQVTYHGPISGIDWRVTCVETGLNSMTGARIKKIKKYIEDDKDFLLTYGDGLGDVDLNALVSFHERHGKALTVTGVRPPARFGELMVDENSRVIEFNEKPQATGGRISGGFFACNRSMFDYLSDDENLVFEIHPVREIVANNEMMMFAHDGFWQPMDTSRDYQLLNEMYDGGAAPWIK